MSCRWISPRRPLENPRLFWTLSMDFVSKEDPKKIEIWWNISFRVSYTMIFYVHYFGRISYRFSFVWAGCGADHWDSLAHWDGLGPRKRTPKWLEGSGVCTLMGYPPAFFLLGVEQRSRGIVNPSELLGGKNLGVSLIFWGLHVEIASVGTYLSTCGITLHLTKFLALPCSNQ